MLFRFIALTALSLCWNSSLLAQPVHALTVYGEAPKYPAGFQHFDYVNPSALKGGSFRRSSMEDGQFDHLIPYVDKGTGVTQIQGWLYSPLAYRSQDEPYTVYGLVAQSMELAEDRTWLRFYLNPHARFDDGTPITATDVRFTFDLLKTQGSLSYRQRFADVDQVIVESPTQVRFTFKSAGNRTLPLDIASLPVLPELWWHSRNFANGGGFEPPLGSGPYRISAVDNGRSVTFERVKHWWGSDLPVSRGLYNFDTLRLEFFGDTDVSRQLLRAQGYDFNREFSATNFMIGYAGQALDDGRLQREHLAPHAVQGTQGFVFNLKKPLFQDRRVRQALSLLWDFDWTNRQIMHGMYLRQRSFFSRSELAATELPDAKERAILAPLRGRIPDEVFDQVYQPPVTSGTGHIRPQQRQALTLLEAAGWTPKGDHLVNARGEPLQFTFLINQKGFERLLLPFKRNLAQIGIGFNIRMIDAAQYANRVRARDYDMIVNGYPVSPSPGAELLNFFSSQSADDPGSNNYMSLKNPAVDVLLDGLVRANDRPTMVRYAHALDRVLQWEYYWIPNYYPPGSSSVWWNRFGRPQIAPLNDVGIDSWWEISKTPLTTAQMRQKTGELIMLAYSARRLLLILPTLLVILLVNFFIVQAAPGGPVEQAIARLQGIGGQASVAGASVETVGQEARTVRGLDPALIADIERQYGFDKPMGERLWLMLKNYARLDFGDSFFRGARVTDLILEKLPVTLSLGFWATLLSYLVSIPLGIRKAVRHGSRFDVWSSAAIIIGHAVPAFLFALLLIVVFGGGSLLNWFPVRGLVSENFAELSWTGKVVDYFWHLVLPVLALVIGSFATLTILTKNSFLDEISRQYVVTARAKGFNERQVLRRHVMRNAMLLIVAGLPQALITMLFGGSLLIEVIFSLDGLGRLSYEAAVSRDYPVVFGTLFIFTLFGLVIKLLGDLCYQLLDPRLDFSARKN